MSENIQKMMLIAIGGTVSMCDLIEGTVISIGFGIAGLAACLGLAYLWWVKPE